MSNEVKLTELVPNVILDLVKSDVKYADLDEALVANIINSYISTKRKFLLEGSGVVEDGIGVQRLIRRKIGKNFNPAQPFTAKISTDIDQKLKNDKISMMLEEVD